MNSNEKKLSEQAKRIGKIRRILAENSNNVFAEKVGITPQLSSSIIAGRKGVGRQLAEKILAAFPELSREWLYTGEGPMIAADNGSQVISGNGNHHNAVNSVGDRLLAIIETDQRERLELLAIIRNLTEKP